MQRPVLRFEWLNYANKGLMHDTPMSVFGSFLAGIDGGTKIEKLHFRVRAVLIPFPIHHDVSGVSITVMQGIGRRILDGVNELARQAPTVEQVHRTFKLV